MRYMVALLLAIATGCGKSPTTIADAPDPNLKEVTVQVLKRAYESDYKEAEARYGDQWLRVVGTVTEVRANASIGGKTKYDLWLGATSDAVGFFAAVYSSPEKIAGVGRGDIVACEGKLFGDLSFTIGGTVNMTEPKLFVLHKAK